MNCGSRSGIFRDAWHFKARAASAVESFGVHAACRRLDAASGRGSFNIRWDGFRIRARGVGAVPVARPALGASEAFGVPARVASHGRALSERLEAHSLDADLDLAIHIPEPPREPALSKATVLAPRVVDRHVVQMGPSSRASIPRAVFPAIFRLTIRWG